MNSRTIPSYLIIKLFILITTQQSSSNPTGIYGTCNSPFTCGAISGVRYPFRRHQDPLYCGYPGFDLNCDDKNPPSINIMNTTYQILDIDPTAQTLRIVREDMIESTCPRDLVNVTIDRSLFEYPSSYMNISFLFGCPFSLTYPTVLGSIFCDNNGVEPVFLLPGNLGPGVCKTSVVVPVPVGFVNSTPLTKFLQDGFEVRWKVDGAGCTGCTRSRGQCVYNYDTGRTMCTCPESANLTDTCTRANLTRAGSTLSSSSSGNSKNKSLSIILPIIGAVLAVVGITWAIFVCRQRRKRGASKAAAVAQTESKAILTTVSSKRLSSNTQSNFTTSIPSYPSSKSSKDYGKSSYFGAQVFTYEELEVATNNFNGSRELGDGGFGTVYYGKLLDGREVAVKRLYENNFKRVEQFMNEVEILTRLHHENLVKLYGCTSKRSRELLLVYEYIPNGTVADHLHGKLANPTSGLFTWSVRINIAIETANALAYLHQSDIIHRDVKTNNILLDKSFRVKVADFGLSRLFPNDATHVSTAPQGTPGYVDPEYYQCYQLTDKSDVYSFGVVLVELISSLQAVDTNRDRLDINLATLAMTKIQNHMLDELVDKRMGFETDGFVRRMMTLVAGLAFRCLQQEKDMRPTMKEVVEVLRGIKDEELNVKKAEVVDIVVDDGGLLTGGVKEPPSPDSGVTDRLVEGSVPNSSDG